MSQVSRGHWDTACSLSILIAAWRVVGPASNYKKIQVDRKRVVNAVRRLSSSVVVVRQLQVDKLQRLCVVKLAVKRVTRELALFVAHDSALLFSYLVARI